MQYLIIKKYKFLIITCYWFLDSKNFYENKLDKKLHNLSNQFEDSSIFT